MADSTQGAGLSAAVIRPAVAADLEGLLTLYAHLNPTDTQPDPGAAGRVWARLLATDGIAVLVRVLPGGELLATCTLIVVANLTRGARPYAMIENVVTHAGHRGRGHGKAVVQAAMEAARQAGCYKVSLATGSRNEATLRFYEATGLERGGKTYFERRFP